MFEVRHKGKGVLCKDNKTPFAAGSLFIVENNMQRGSSYSVSSLVNALMDLTDRRVDMIRVITHSNHEFEITL